MIKRNDKQNLDRKFKDIAVGDRIYIKNNIRKHKFVQRYSGPFRVIGLKGSTVFCYSLANKKHKQVTMDKVRYAGDLSQDEAPDLLQAFPEEEPIVADEILDASQLVEQPNTSKQTLPETKSCDRGMNSNSLQRNHIATRKPNHTHRYVLRPR